MASGLSKRSFAVEKEWFEKYIKFGVCLLGLEEQIKQLQVRTSPYLTRLTMWAIGTEGAELGRPVPRGR
jgi:hypothetical protein